MYPAIDTSIQSIQELSIEAHRSVLLDRYAEVMSMFLLKEQECSALFVCTHNSRRSFMCEIWMSAIIHKLDLPIKVFSGGTKTTDFHPNAQAAMKSLGFKIFDAKEGPRKVYFDEDAFQMVFSKRYDHIYNPRKNFFAFMVCDDVHEVCPVVERSLNTWLLKYVDPKFADGADDVLEVYRQTAMQIGAEIYYLCRQIAQRRVDGIFLTD